MILIGAWLIRRALAGQLQMWGFSWNNGPDGDFFLGLAYGPNADQSNDARFRLPAFDALYERQRALPLLKEARAECPKNAMEYEGTLAELRSLQRR